MGLLYYCYGKLYSVGKVYRIECGRQLLNLYIVIKMKLKSPLLLFLIVLITSCNSTKVYLNKNHEKDQNQNSIHQCDLTVIDSLLVENNIKLIEIEEKIECNQSNSPKRVLRNQFLKCYVIRPSYGRYKRGLLGVYTSNRDSVLAFTLNIPSDIKEDSIIYLKLEKIHNSLNVKEWASSTPDESKMYEKGRPTIAQLSAIFDYLIEMERGFHQDDGNKGWHREGHIIVKRTDNLFKVFNPLVQLSQDGPWIRIDSVEYYSYSYNDTLLNVNDTIIDNYVLDTINFKIFLRTVEKDHFPHPPE